MQVIRRFSYPRLQSRYHLDLQINSQLYYKLHNCASYESTRCFTLAGAYSDISNSSPVITIQDCVLEFHEWSGLPWWAVIAVTTFTVRSFLLPLAIHQQQVIARLSNLKVELEKLAPELNKEVNMAKVMYNWDSKTAKKVFYRQMQKLNQDRVIRDNCHPFKIGVLVLIQVPVWFCVSVAWRCLSLGPHQFVPALAKLKTEGLLWFTDLTSPDMFAIPLLLVVVNSALMELHAVRKSGQQSRLQKIVLNISRIIIILVGAAATVNPSSVTFYWLCSSSFGLGQNILFLLPKVRRFLNIPLTKHESSKPFQDLANGIRKRFFS